MFISTKRLYLTPTGEVSEEPVSGGTLLVPVGGEMSNADAERFGLTGEPSSEEKAAKPESNKARKGTGNKAAATTEE